MRGENNTRDDMITNRKQRTNDFCFTKEYLMIDGLVDERVHSSHNHKQQLFHNNPHQLFMNTKKK